MKRHYSTIQFLKGVYRNAEEGYFTRAGSGRTRENSFKLKEGRFRWDLRKKCFCCVGGEALEQAAREAVDVSSLKLLKTRP